MSLIPSRRAAVAPFMAMEVLREARRLEREGRRIVHMELGEPGAPTPRRLLEAAQRALAAGAPGYGEAAGDPALRAPASKAERKARRKAPDEPVVTITRSGLSSTP